MFVLGQHVLLELFECREEKLNDKGFIRIRLEEAAQRAGCTIVESIFHRFSPFGFSGVIMIAESHFAIHTWPEYRYAAVDMFTCGENVRTEEATAYLVEEFEAQRTSAVTLRRGVFTKEPPRSKKFPPRPVIKKPA